MSKWFFPKLGGGEEQGAVMIVDFHPKGAGTCCCGLANPAHAKNTKCFSAQVSAQHSGRRPASPFVGLYALHALGCPSGGPEQQEEGDVCGRIGHYVWRVGDVNRPF